MDTFKRQPTDRKYIRKERQKTKVEFVVPLHPIAEAIINQYKKERPSMKEMQTVKEKGDDFIFHCACSRSVMSAKLSIVGKACGIRERLSYHMARHTFGTMSLSAGDTHREHCQDDGARLHIKHPNLCTGDGQ